ncbi:MAG: MarR family transcriptional regulator [Aeromicrobium sp.]
MTEGDEQQRERVLNGLLAFTAVQSEAGRRFARAQRLHTTDAAAMVEILTAEDRGQPLTPARLAERIALTSGATSTLLNRLEAAGHIVRTREHSDRRVVTLHVTPASHEVADAFYAPLSEQLDAVLSDFSAEDLDLVDQLVDRLRSTVRAYLDAADQDPTGE